MKKILGLICALVVMLAIALPATPAGADDLGKYFPGVTNGSVIVRLGNDTGWSDNQVGAVRAAVHEWNSERDADDPFLDFDGGEHLYAWQGCNTFPHILIQRVGANFLGDGVLADTDWATYLECYAGSSDKILASRIRFEDPDNAYYGDSNPEPDDKRGIEGIVTHELGHALGFVGHWEGTNHADEYCNNPQSNQNPGNYATMCHTPYKDNPEGNEGEQPQENRWVSLTNGDVNWFGARYGS